ncbi:putative glycosidase CRH2, partial [Coemansia spiralis]
MNQLLQSAVLLVTLLGSNLHVVQGIGGICLREIFFGQDTNGGPFSPRQRLGVMDLSQPIRELDQLYLRDSGDNGLVTVIGPGSGQVNLADLTTAAGSNQQSTSSPSSTSVSSILQTASSHAVTSTTSTITSTSPTSSASENAPVAIVDATYSQESTGRQYTCQRAFIDFSSSDAMSKFSFVWCPQNAYQTDNSVVWKLTSECGMTMVYPWDFHYGKIEGRIRIGAGSGVVTAMLLLGPAPSDEIDFEWVGKDITHVQTMYYVQAHRVDNLPEVFGVSQQGGGDLSTTFQDYAIELTEDSVKWYLNGQVLRTLGKDSQEFPSDASRARMGIWDGTQTGGWAGAVDWSQGPFTAEMQ